MNNCPIERRKFIKTGFASGVVLATSPVSKLFSFPAPFFDARQEPDRKHSWDEHERLIKIALRHGAEFGEVSVEWDQVRIKEGGYGSI